VVIVLDRPRHEKSLKRYAPPGAHPADWDGDLSAGISAGGDWDGRARSDGTGGAPEGVDGACAALLERTDSCAAGGQQTGARGTLAKMGVKDLKRVYDTEDLAPGKKMIFRLHRRDGREPAEGVRFFGEGVRTSSMILTLDDRQVRFNRFRASGKRGRYQVRSTRS